MQLSAMPYACARCSPFQVIPDVEHRLDAIVSFAGRAVVFPKKTDASERNFASLCALCIHAPPLVRNGYGSIFLNVPITNSESSQTILSTLILSHDDGAELSSAATLGAVDCMALRRDES